MSNVKIVKIVVSLLVVVGVGLALGWLASRSSQAPPKPADMTLAPATPQAQSNAHQVLRTTLNKLGTDATPATNQSAAPVVSTNLITDWEDRLDNILGGEGEDAAKAKQMLEMFPNLPEDGQVEVAQHLANLTPDSDYAGLGKYLADPNTPEAVIDVLMGDLLNRPNSVKLPLLVDVARNSSNPKAEEAKNLLELYLEEDYGTDWGTWQAKVDDWLKANPD